MDINVDKDNLKHIIEFIANTFKTISNELRSDLLKKEELKDPDDFYTLLLFDIEDKIRDCIDIVYDFPKIPFIEEAKIKEKVYFIYQNYDFVRRHIHDMLIKKKDNMFSQDKISFLVNSYLSYLVSGILIDMEKRKKDSIIPNFGTAKQWFSYIDSLYFLYHGEPDLFFVSYMSLVKEQNVH